MAIVQVSRITNRKGLTENLPQLAGAELGWCIDTRRLFIGNGTLEEGAPVIGNTEILTEFSDITTTASYTYIDAAAGYVVQTGPTPSTPVVRTVQAKLDDFASVRDFGAVGDGSTDDTVAINRALNQLYCQEPLNTRARRTLYFPAGTYLVSDTIDIPTWAKLVGEGANCTFIYLDPSDSSVPTYVAQYADSLQQTGVNIGNNGAVAPSNIEISGITFQTAITTDVFLVIDSTQCWFDSADFVGPLTNVQDAVDNIAGLRFSGVSTQFTADKCRFSGLNYGINTDDPVSSATVSNGRFENLYRGIVLAEATAVGGGATGFRAVGNMFDDIYAEGIYYGEVNLCATAYNIFYDVGTSLTGTPSWPVITFNNENSVSISDLFERTDSENNSFPRVQVTVTTPQADPVGSEMQIGRYARLTGRTYTLPDASANVTMISTNPSQVSSFSMDYTMIRSGNVRHGTFVVSSAGANTQVFMDDYTETTDIGVVMTAQQTSANTLVVLGSSTATGANIAITYSISHLA